MLLHREAELAVRSASCIKSNLILYSVFQKVSNVIFFNVSLSFFFTSVSISVFTFLLGQGQTEYARGPKVKDNGE